MLYQQDYQVHLESLEATSIHAHYFNYDIGFNIILQKQQTLISNTRNLL